jgi:hypothetical protein
MPARTRCEHCRRWFSRNVRGRRRRYCSAACRQAAYLDRRNYLVRSLVKPKSRCVYCQQPLPKGRTRRRLYCSPSCAQMAYLRRKLADPMRLLVADIQAIRRRAAIARAMENQVNQALSAREDGSPEE